jgi:S-adenosylmethionine synthetase
MKENQKWLFTSESVTEGHPDKVCDKIADAILDAILEKDPRSHVAVEACATTGLVVIMGEVTTNCYVDIAQITRSTIQDIGYNTHKCGFDGATCGVVNTIKEQSPDIALGLKNEEDLGAGDQGMMFGFACNETPEFMPMPIMLAHKLAKQLADVRKNNIFSYLRPDGKTQVTIEYEGYKPIRVEAIVISAQHDPDVSEEQLAQDVKEHVVKLIVDPNMIDNKTKYFINPTGRFVIGGPEGDSGLTGRKIIIDTYGGYARHGGGSFSGKDPTKVDRTGAYAARYVAKNIVAAGFADRCEIQLAYAIGVAQPVSIMIDTFGTNTISVEEIKQKVINSFDFRPTAIIKRFDLRKPIYRNLSNYGHFGKKDLEWEKLNLFNI